MQVTSTSASVRAAPSSVSGDRPAADGVGEQLGPGQGAVHAGHVGAGRGGGPGGQAGHGPGADDQHPAAGERAALVGQQPVAPR